MAPWVHRCAGLAELAVLVLRSGVAWCAFRGSKVVGSLEARRCAAAHVIVAGPMGGALWTWPCGVAIKRGLLPGCMVLLSSSLSTSRWLQLAEAKGMGAEERLTWHAASACAALVGAFSA